MGPRKELPPLPDPRSQHAPRRRVCRRHRDAELQLRAGPRGRHRHLPPRLPAPRAVDPGNARPPAPSTTTPSTSATRATRSLTRTTGTSYAAYRDASRGQLLLALRPLPAALLLDDPHRRPRHSGPRTAWVPHRRRAHHVLEHDCPQHSTIQFSWPGWLRPAARKGINIDGKTGSSSYIPNGTGWYDRWNLTRTRTTTT